MMKRIVAVLSTILFFCMLNPIVSDATECKWGALLEIKAMIDYYEFLLPEPKVENQEELKEKVANAIKFLKELREKIKPIPEKGFYPKWVIMREEMNARGREVDKLLYKEDGE